MKKILLSLAALMLFACKQEPKNYVTISGTIIEKNSDSLFIFQGRNYTKTIKVNEDGTFNDTLKVKAGVFGLYDGNEQTSLFLKNGYDIKLNINTKKFDESLSFSGHGAKSNNYLKEKSILQEQVFTTELFDLEETEFKSEVDRIGTKLTELLEASKVDSTLYNLEKKELASLPQGILVAYQRQKSMSKQFDAFNGKAAPKFENYENYKGGTTSLNDLKGKYVYVDVWATWCGPCKREIPSLKKIEKQYHGKNIEFVSISVDDGRGFKGDMAAAKEGWKKMIAEKELGGIQLLSDNGWKSDFVRNFNINGIPRFILIDPQGNVVNANAPRPSSKKLTELFNSLNI